MNFEQLQARAAAHAALGGWVDVTPPPDWPTLVNDAYQNFCWDAECIIGTETIATVVDQAEYTLVHNWKSVQDCYYDTSSTKQYLYGSSERAERQDDPKWLYAVSGTPHCYILAMQSTLRLHRPPNAVVNVLMRGVVLPAEMSSLTENPLVPGAFHEGIAKFAAARQGELWARGEETMIIQRLMAGYDQDVADYRKGVSPGRIRAASRVQRPRKPLRIRL